MKELLKKYKIDDVKHANTPMTLNTKLDIDSSGKSVSEKVHRGVIDSLLYLIASRLDIIFSICLFTWFQSAPKESHLTVKGIFRYLVGTKDIGLWYPRDGEFNLIKYSDAAYVGYKVNRNSTFGYY